MAEKNQEVRDLLEVSDLLVDGPYLAEERDLSVAFRGSRNQRILSVAESLKAKRAVEAVL
jgi:anaerobic ribonucleoside-triphosphate reductase activating protein